MKKSLSVAVPWSLSHYIPLNGFHPLYHALFDHAPARVALNAWDNIKLHERLVFDLPVRSQLLSAAEDPENKAPYTSGNRIGREYRDYFWPPNQVLTAQLPGEIEFHHTAPFASLTRPFVLYCESFAPIFYPFAQQDTGPFADHDQLREHYRKILVNPLCLGIFSHIPETFERIGTFFGDAGIDRKLFPSTIGLSRRLIGREDIETQGDISVAKFLFINSAHRNPIGFFERGGHNVLRFWERYRRAGRRGLLVMRCTRPGDAELKAHGVDAVFVSAATGKSIVWIEEYLTNRELTALLEEMHFLLLPGATLHSVSIMAAMANGVIPVVTDTAGTSRYVTDGDNGIVLEGIREALWQQDPRMGAFVDQDVIDQYRAKPEIDERLVAQLWSRVTHLLDDPTSYWQMCNQAFHHARASFSGEAFSAGFWQKVVELYEGWDPRLVKMGNQSCKIGERLRDTLIGARDWKRVFESPTQPLKRVYIGQSVIWECGGTFIAAIGDNQEVRPTDWSVLASYFDKAAPELLFGSAIADLGDRFLATDSYGSEGYIYTMVKRISRLLAPYPAVYGFFKSILRRYRGYWRIVRRYRRYRRFKRSGGMTELDVELVAEGVLDIFNVVRFFHRYYAVPLDMGPFDVMREIAGEYHSLLQGPSLDDVMVTILANAMPIVLIQEGVNGYNLLQWNTSYYAVPQRMGSVDTVALMQDRNPDILVADSLSDIRAIVSDKGTGIFYPPFLRFFSKKGKSVDMLRSLDPRKNRKP